MAAVTSVLAAKVATNKGATRRRARERGRATGAFLLKEA